MRIAHVRIENFCALGSVEMDFDDVTTLVGPNGVGKSTVLRALDWFFNNGQQLSVDDVHWGAGEDSDIVVEVTFGSLTADDRARIESTGALLAGDAWSVERRWTGESDDYVTATGSYPPFAEIRTLSGVARRTAYKEFREAHGHLELPAATSVAAADTAMAAFEHRNPDLLAPDSRTIPAPFGFQTGATFSNAFDYVFVEADLRATEEVDTGRSTILGRILAGHSTSDGTSARLQEILDEADARQRKVVDAELTPKLDQVGLALTAELAELTKGRSIHVTASPVRPRPTGTVLAVHIKDNGQESAVDHQGHGFQRALMIAGLKFLAISGNAGSGTVLLAIEEPELFQHPSQARVFARTLRQLAEDPAKGFQVAYATHSPYFIDASRFEQVRRLTSSIGADSVRSVTVRSVTKEQVITRLEPHINTDGISSRWEQVCRTNLAEAFFAAAAVVVEGTDDARVIEELAHRSGDPLEDHDVVVAEAHGKPGLLTLAAILEGLSIPMILVYDNDNETARDVAHKASQKDDPEAYTREAVANQERDNRRILGYFGADTTDPWLEGEVAPRVFALGHNLEEVLKAWPEWDAYRKELVTSGRGSRGKNAATYALATQDAPGDPPQALLDVVAAAHALPSTTTPATNANANANEEEPS